MRLSASDEREAIRRADELLRILDERFEYAAPLKPVGGLVGDFFNTHELHSKTLSQVMEEEGLEW